MGIYCDLSNLKEPENEYVCWLDIMGTKNNMLDSVKGSANFILKLHAAVLENHRQYSKSIKLYPIMDGVYITTKSCNDLQRFLAIVFYALSEEFIETSKKFYRFFVKASIAYGPIYHGVDIPNNVNNCYPANNPYKNSMLFGAPMVQANEGEKKHHHSEFLFMNPREHLAIHKNTPTLLRHFGNGIITIFYGEEVTGKLTKKQKISI